jgi:acyl-CoA thioesterase
MDESPLPQRGVSLDDRLLGMVATDDPCVTTYVLEPHLCRPDGVLYGGTALAAACAAMERATGRPTLWATVQFVSTAPAGSVVDSVVEIGARGGRIDQVRVTGSVEGRLVYQAIGSAASPAEDGLAGVGVTMPVVPPPEACGGVMGGPPREIHADWDMATGQHLVAEFRTAEIEGDHPVGRVAMWARLRGESETTAAKLGFLADMVPIAIVRMAGLVGAGTSLDNSLRLGPLVDSEWVLMDLHGFLAHGSYGHGVVHCWSPDGTCMATGGQTAKLFTFESMMAKRAARA